MAVAAVVVASFWLRLWRLADLPPGLHIDEAFNILDARAVAAGSLPLFLPANAGREALYTYLQAPLLALLGESAWSARLASVFAGTCAVPAVWVFARRLPVRNRSSVALAAAVLMGGLFWALHFSRFGIRAVALTPLAALALAAWRRASDPRRPDAGGEVAGTPASGAAESVRLRWARGSGLLLALALYAHPAGRLLWLVPAADAFWAAARKRRLGSARATPAPRLRPDLPEWQLLGNTLTVLALAALPLALYWARHPGLFVGHAQEVSVLQDGVGAIASNLAHVGGMFHFAGDPAPWRNLQAPSIATVGLAAARPVFDPLLGLGFLWGSAAVVIAAGRGARWAGLTLLWLAAMLLPTVATDAAPNFSRAIGALPAIVVVAAFGVSDAVRRLPLRATALIGVVTLAAPAIAGYDYFATYARAPETALAFDADKVGLGEWAAGGPGRYVSGFAREHPTVRVAADWRRGGNPGLPPGFDPRRGLVLGPEPSAYGFLEWEKEAQDALAGWFAPGALRTTVVRGADPAAGSDRPSPAPGDLVVSTLPNPALEQVRLDWRVPPAAAGFGRAITLAAASWPDTVTAGRPFRLVLAWRCAAVLDRDWTTFVHLLGADRAAVAFGDGPPLGGSYPTSAWRVDELIVSVHELTPPADLGGRFAPVEVGWYDLATDARLPLDRTADRTATEIGVVRVGP